MQEKSHLHGERRPVLREWLCKPEVAQTQGLRRGEAVPPSWSQPDYGQMQLSLGCHASELV